MENKPLAQMLFKFGRPGKEIPFQFFSAVAEILAMSTARIDSAILNREGRFQHNRWQMEIKS